MKDAGEPMRSVIGRAVGRWDDSRELAFVAPAACVIHEAVFLTRYISFLPLEYDAASVWLLVGCVAAILTCVFLRRRFPLAAMLAACACAAVSSPVDEGAYTGVPLLVLMYGLVARRDHLKAAASVLAVIAAFWVPVHLAGDENLALVHLEWILAVVVAALVSRALWTRRRADQELEDERTAREQIARERDEAEARSRIAGELHDSVGHDLTAIIALSEGLMGTTGDETLDAAVASINDLARAGLSDTRRAVRQLSALHGDAADAGRSGLHTWDDIRPVLEHARSAGLAVAFTETGSRSSDRAQAELAFSVTREAVTNVLRHACGARRVTVAWDHAGDGSCMVTVRDDGSPVEGTGDEGTGLARLGRRVEEAGGDLSAGPSPDGGWEVRASIPHLDPAPDAEEAESL